jgi:MFS family permease
MRRVLRTPGVLPLFLASCVARLPMGAVGLLFVLHTQELTGSYARGGLVAGAYTLALGISNPILARVADRRGQTVVLLGGAPVAAGALVAAALLPAGAHNWLVVCAALAGAAQPPVGACMRALWPVLMREADARHAAYATEGVALEIVYICGPLAIVAGIGAWSLTAALGACAVFLLAGDLAFAASGASRAWRPERAAARDVAGALRGRGVRVLMAVFALCGLAIGAVEVCTPAMLDAMGHRNLTGVMLGLWGLGSMLAGVAVAKAGAPADATRRLVLALAAWGLAHAAVALAGSPLQLGLLLMVAGATIAPTLVCANGMLDGLAPAGTLTEAFTWTSTGMAAGFAAGSTLAGALVDAASPAVALAVLGSGGLVAALLVRGAGVLREPVAVPA